MAILRKLSSYICDDNYVLTLLLFDQAALQIARNDDIYLINATICHINTNKRSQINCTPTTCITMIDSFDNFM